MPVDESGPASAPGGVAPGLAARRLVRMALKGSLGTLLFDRPGHPYASLVLVATEPDGTPVLLISQLALHTRNLQKDARATLLIDGTAGLGDPLTGGRLTLIGHVRTTASPTAARRFLARHPAAAAYAGFTDFSMYAFEPAGGHFIGGFGRIVDLAPVDLLSGVDDAQKLVAAEPDILSHMNTDHREAVALYATELAQCDAGDWRLTGIDPNGIDLLHCSNAARIDFGARVRNPEEARDALVALAKQARDRRQRNGAPH